MFLCKSLATSMNEVRIPCFVDAALTWAPIHAVVQVPDLFYRAIVKRKDAAHPGAVVIRFPEDGSTFWLPADEVISNLDAALVKIAQAAYRATVAS